MSETIERYGYDGEWFLRGYDAFGNKIGSKDCEEGKIFIEPQGFCVMAGVGKDTSIVCSITENTPRICLFYTQNQSDNFLHSEAGLRRMVYEVEIVYKKLK